MSPKNHSLFTLMVFCILCYFTWPQASQAQVSSGISYHARLLKSDDSPVVSTAVQIQMQIRSPGAENCLLFSEIHTRDLSSNDGLFSVTLGDGTAVRNDSSGLTLGQVLGNQGTRTLPAGSCAAGTTYSPGATDGRRLTVYFNDGSFSGWESFPDEAVNYAPLAIESQQIAGYRAVNLLRAPATSTVSELTAPQIAEFLNVINGTSTKYMSSSTTSSVSIPNYTTASPPSTPVAGSLWFDTTDKQMKFYDGTSTSVIGNTSALAGSSITSGVVAPARLGSGTADNTKFLRGDGAWSAVPSSQWTTSGSDIYYSTGKVGIGTSTPAYSLTVAGTSVGVGTGLIEFAANKLNLGISNSVGTNSSPIAIGSSNSSDYSSVMIGRSNSSGAAAAAVGLGINNLTGRDGSVTVGINNTVSAPAMNSVAIGLGITNSVNNSLMIGPSDTAKMTILTSGNVGIGTTSPTANLHVVRSAASTASFDSAGSSTYSSVDISKGGTAYGTFVSYASDNNFYISSRQALGKLVMSGGTGSGSHMTIDSTGNVGIGTTSPTVALDVNGAIKSTAVSNAGSSIDFSSGNLQYTSDSCEPLTLNNLKSGATYNLAVQGTAGGTCSFTAYSGNGSGALTVKSGSTVLTQTASKHVIFSFMVMGSFVYVAAADGY